MLIIFAGLPATGKSTLSRELARELQVVHLRIDSIECALLAGLAPGQSVGDLGYRAAYAIAEDNLRLGRTVVADSVNPLEITRQAWRSVAACARVGAVEVEIVCSDPVEHRRRVETRAADIAGHELPNWQDVLAREYESWTGPHLVIDTAGKTVMQSLEDLLARLALKI